MNLLKNKKFNIVLRILPVAICVALIIFLLVSKKGDYLEWFLSYTPHNQFLAAIFLLFMYALKSMSIIFPLIVLHIAGGYLFPPVTAIIINILGVFICLTIPYLAGRFSGSEIAEKLINKYPKLKEFSKKQLDNGFFLSYILRAIGCLPGDVISMYFGSIKLQFSKYFWGSFLGTLPGIITTTLMGNNITDPTSSAFIISTILTISIALISIIVYAIYLKIKKNK